MSSWESALGHVQLATFSGSKAAAEDRCDSVDDSLVSHGGKAKNYHHALSTGKRFELKSRVRTKENCVQAPGLAGLQMRSVTLAVSFAVERTVENRSKRNSSTPHLPRNKAR